MTKNKIADVETLLQNWEQTYKKGLLTFWILLILHERPCYPLGMNRLVTSLSGDTISADDNSIYRALYRFEEMGIVNSMLVPSDSRQTRRYFMLTPTGLDLLQQFIKRNVLLFQTPDLAHRIQSVFEQPAGNMEMIEE